jgi:hypothetical protein
MQAGNASVVAMVIENERRSLRRAIPRTPPPVAVDDPTGTLSNGDTGPVSVPS